MLPNTQKYPPLMRALHWLMAIIIIAMLALGLIMEGIPRENPLHQTLYDVHKSFGVLVLMLFAIRISLRLRFGSPALPAIISGMVKKLALAGHYLLYLLMFIMPASGYLMTNSFGFPVRFFGIALPKVIGIDKEAGMSFATIHAISAYILIFFIVVHIGAVILHLVKDRVNLLKRMW